MIFFTVTAIVLLTLWAAAAILAAAVLYHDRRVRQCEEAREALPSALDKFRSLCPGQVLVMRPETLRALERQAGQTIDRGNILTSSYVGENDVLMVDRPNPVPSIGAFDWSSPPAAGVFGFGHGLSVLYAGKVRSCDS